MESSIVRSTVSLLPSSTFQIFAFALRLLIALAFTLHSSRRTRRDLLQPGARLRCSGRLSSLRVQPEVHPAADRVRRPMSVSFLRRRTSMRHPHAVIFAIVHRPDHFFSSPSSRKIHNKRQQQQAYMLYGHFWLLFRSPIFFAFSDVTSPKLKATDFLSSLHRCHQTP